MSWIAGIDRIILTICENIAHSVQKNFGVHPCSIAYGGLVVYGCSALMTWVIPGYDLIPKIMFGGILFVWTMLVAFITFPVLRKEIDKDAQNGLSNKHKIDRRYVFIRMLCLSLLLFSVWYLYWKHTYVLRDTNDVLMMSGYMTYLYFLSVDPLPPGPSRFRKWVESTFQRRRLAYIVNR